LQESGQKEHLIYDKLVFQKIKDLFGGKIRQIVSASAPLSKKNFELM
jgi:long-chain acyl-CoA synthetase